MNDFDSFINLLSPEQKQKLMEVILQSSDMQNVLPDSKGSNDNTQQKEESVSSKNSVKVNSDFTVTREIREAKGRVPVKAKKNTWVDMKDHYPDDEFDMSRKRSSRNRSKPKKVQVECSSCGKTFHENPSLIFGDYPKCNRCAGGR